MTSKPNVFLAGIGYSSLPSDSSPKGHVASLVSAATKALLDAGVTYDDVTKGVRSTGLKHGDQVFKAFDQGGITVDAVEGGAEFQSSSHQVRDRGAQCVLTVAIEKSAAVALIFVSDRFLWSRPYLKDSSALLREISTPHSKSDEQIGLYEVCRKVWALRGWSQSKDNAGREKPLHYKGFELSRADSQAIPTWKDVEHKHDGKHRLRYNPASETKDVSQEDFDAVKAIGKRSKEADFQPMGGDRAALAKL